MGGNLIDLIGWNLNFLITRSLIFGHSPTLPYISALLNLTIAQWCEARTLHEQICLGIYFFSLQHQRLWKTLLPAHGSLTQSPRQREFAALFPTSASLTCDCNRPHFYLFFVHIPMSLPGCKFSVAGITFFPHFFLTPLSRFQCITGVQ